MSLPPRPHLASFVPMASEAEPLAPRDDFTVEELSRWLLDNTSTKVTSTELFKGAMAIIGEMKIDGKTLLAEQWDESSVGEQHVFLLMLSASMCCP